MDQAAVNAAFAGLGKALAQQREVKVIESKGEDALHPIISIPDGYKLETIDLERFLPAPKRKRATVFLHDTESFIWYLKEHGSLTTCRVYVEFGASNAKLIGVVNDHGVDSAGNEAPSWRDHRAIYAPEQTPEWKTWIANHGKSMDQEAFATFIVDNLPDIATVEGMPSGTAMVEMATNLDITREGAFKRAVNLQSGAVNMIYADRDNEATERTMALYKQFALGLAVFRNGGAYRVDARLKYRTSSGKASFWYELVRPHRVVEDAIKTEIATIREKTGFPVLLGRPE